MAQTGQGANGSQGSDMGQGTSMDEAVTRGAKVQRLKVCASSLATDHWIRAVAFRARRCAGVLAASLMLSACGDGPGDAEPRVPAVDQVAARTAAATIRGAEVLQRIAVMADDSMRGRPTPSPELDQVANWIAGEFGRWGLQPLDQARRSAARPSAAQSSAAPASGFVRRYRIPADADSAGVSAPNVVGVVEGSDPELRGEYVVFSAHIDHVGVGAPDASGDSIYNGADDDASGVAVMMEVAEAFASLDPRPRRSALFVMVSGEEGGLWGSNAIVADPNIDLDALVANFNADMVGRNWPDTIVAIGREHSELGTLLESVQRRLPELGMTAIDDRWPDEQFFFRSDHYTFARHGIPALFFFNGVHDDYHRPSDEVDRIDADKAARIGRLIFHLGLEVADRPERPQWNASSRRRIVDGGG